MILADSLTLSCLEGVTCLNPQPSVFEVQWCCLMIIIEPKL